jgi:hypothetical protein
MRGHLSGRERIAMKPAEPTVLEGTVMMVGKNSLVQISV